MQARIARAKLNHEQRTVKEVRNKELYNVAISNAYSPVDSVRIINLAIENPAGIKFLAGQWLDVFVPGVREPGGFSITSAPHHAVPKTITQKQSLKMFGRIVSAERGAFLELAVKDSPDNPVAAWLWQPRKMLLGKSIQVRVGGSFVWPPPGLHINRIKRVVFVAGGMGINPLMSMISTICERDIPVQVCLLYSRNDISVADPFQGLFVPRIFADIIGHGRRRKSKNLLTFYATSYRRLATGMLRRLWLSLPPFAARLEDVSTLGRRIDHTDFRDFIDGEEAARPTAFYVCGPPQMTDEIVEYLRASGMEHVYCEKWW